MSAMFPPTVEWSMSSWDSQEQLWLRSWEVADSSATVVIVHGLSDHGQRYGEMASLFNQGCFNALTVDLRGHGLSSGQRGHADAWMKLQQDVGVALQAARQRAPRRPVILLGHSMGGTLVLSMLAEQRELLHEMKVAAALAWSPLILPTREPPGWKLRLGNWLGRHWPRATFRTHIPMSALTHDEERAERFRVDPLRHGRISARLAVEMFAAGRRLLEQAVPLPLPCLVQHGTQDEVTDCQATQRWFQAQAATDVGELRLWPGCAHELWQERNCREIIVGAVAWCQQLSLSHFAQ